MTELSGVISYPYLDLKNGVYHYSEEIKMEFLLSDGDTFYSYNGTVREFYFSLMEIFGKKFENHSKIIEIIRGVYDQIKPQIDRSFELGFGASLKFLDEGMRFTMPGYEKFLKTNEQEIAKFSVDNTESELSKITTPADQYLFLVNLHSEYKKYRLKLKVPQVIIKEMFDFKAFDDFEEQVNIEIQRIERTLKLNNSLAGNLDHEVPSSPSVKVNRNTGIKFNTRYIDAIYDNVEFLFSGSDKDYLKLLLEGQNISSKLLFLKSGNQLADIFKQLFHLHVVITEGDKGDLEDWLLNNFRYHDLTKKGRIADFNKAYLVKQISGKVDPCKNPIFKISIDSFHNLCFETLEAKQRNSNY